MCYAYGLTFPSAIEHQVNSTILITIGITIGSSSKSVIYRVRSVESLSARMITKKKNENKPPSKVCQF